MVKQNPDLKKMCETYDNLYDTVNIVDDSNITIRCEELMNLLKEHAEEKGYTFRIGLSNLNKFKLVKK